MSESENLTLKFLKESGRLYDEIERVSLAQEVAGERALIITTAAVNQLNAALCRWAASWATMCNTEARAQGLIK